MIAYRHLIIWVMFIINFMSVSISSGQENLPAIIKKIKPSTVIIITYNKEGGMLGQGSGFFITKDGDVITNNHVLEGASRAEVKTDGGKIYPVKKVLAEDKDGDLIRLSIEMSGEVMSPLYVSTSVPEVGERIIVMGSPMGLEKTVSDGIVSAIREIPGFGKIVQVTAPISPGSSGSPIVNMNGEVIGIAAFYVLAGQNLNFAIPGERIARLKPGEGKTLSEREGTRIGKDLIFAERLYSEGLRFLWVEDYEKALPYFIESAKKNPDYPGAYFQIGYCFGKLGRYSEAIEFYKQSIRIKSDDPDAYNNLCASYGKLGHYQEAVESCKDAIRIKPDHAEAYNNLGWSYHKLGRYLEAIESCKQAIRIKPDFAVAHYNLGNNYSILKRYPEAIESYKQAIRIKPDLSEAHLDLGMTYLRLGDRGSAVDEYKILKDLDKNLSNQSFNLIYE
jgi:tetratricopeptide (TPR) repeat protein